MTISAADLDALLPRLQPFVDQGLSPTKAFLAWFLDNYYRLDDVALRDAICDNPNDKGIDGVYVHEIDQEIHFFQSKLRQSERIKGEGDLKNLSGSVSQFTTADRVQTILDSDANKELKTRLAELDIKGLIGKGYRPVGVYVTNAPIDGNAKSYLAANPDVVAWDADDLSGSYVDLKQAEGIQENFVFNLDQAPIPYSAGATAKMYLAIVPANELVKLGGISDQRLFDRNVRRDLGGTPVNKNIAESVKNKSSHDRFPLFHNGVTLLAEKVASTSDKITVKNYMVVNGAQSVSTLSRNAQHLTDDLKIVLRVVEVGRNATLVDEITTYSNNQNAIKPRDKKSNDKLQTRLQADVAKHYGQEFYFVIKRGDKPPEGLEAVQNDEIGRLLLSFDLEEPWSAHQIYRIFEDEHSRIFGRPEVDADRVVFLHILSNIISDHLEEISDPKIRSYRLTRYFLAYAVRLVLDLSDDSHDLVSNPGKYLEHENVWDRVYNYLNDLVANVVVDFDTEIDTDEEEFDYKSELKSETGVTKLARRIVNAYRKELRKGRAKELTSYIIDEL